MYRKFPKPKKCKVQGKTKYATEDAARKGLTLSWGKDPSMNLKDMHTYLCPSCHTYHFGHISYYQKALEKQNESHSVINA